LGSIVDKSPTRGGFTRAPPPIATKWSKKILKLVLDSEPSAGDRIKIAEIRLDDINAYEIRRRG
jgi:hypothetical protein